MLQGPPEAGHAQSPPCQVVHSFAPPALAGINVIVPMAGDSTDFSRAGYRFPKPLVNIVGRPLVCWMIDWLKLSCDDTLLVAVRREVDSEHRIQRRLLDEYPKLDIRFVMLDFMTRGPAETLFAALQHLSERELERRTISLDCDNIFFADILTQFRTLPPGLSASWYCDATTANASKASFSYLCFVDSKNGDEGHRFISDVREKVVVSCHANVGAYGFESGTLLRRHCEHVVDDGHVVEGSSAHDCDHGQNDTHGAWIVSPSSPAKGTPGDSGKWYLSNVMRHMLRSDMSIVGLKLMSERDFVALGTPALLQDYLRSLQAGDTRLCGSRRMRVVFELDGTLVTLPKLREDFASVSPIQQNVDLIRSLKAAGHYVIIWTSRGFERHGGNTGAIVAAHGRETMDTLERLQIPYDELIFGKPHANAYIDDCAINSRVDTQKELGWAVSTVADVNAGVAGGVAARSFNTVRPLDDRHVAKAGPCHVMRGEIYWYRHIPSSLVDLFPTPVEISDTGTHMASMVMTKINGVPFTHLLVNHCLTPARLQRFLDSLHRVHSAMDDGVLELPFTSLSSSPSSCSYSECDHVPDHALYVNLRPKLRDRFENNASLYRSFSVSEVGFDTEDFARSILDFLEGYEAEGRACRADYIHGDPVFSNALLTDEGNVRFLDMRGALGDLLSTCGDVVYDLAKVYQSLCGYDFFLQDRELLPSSQRFLNQLQRVFWSHVASKYPRVLPSDVRLVTASHFFSLVPLHEVRLRMRLCLRTANFLLHQEDIGASFATSSRSR